MFQVSHKLSKDGTTTRSTDEVTKDRNYGLFHDDVTKADEEMWL